MNTKVIVLLAACLSVAAQAQTTTPPAPAASADSKNPVVIDIHAGKAAPDRHCLRATGSRIVRKDKYACLGVPGRSYDRGDLERTGAIDIGDALQSLDPSISVHH